MVSRSSAICADSQCRCSADWFCAGVTLSQHECHANRYLAWAEINPDWHLLPGLRYDCTSAGSLQQQQQHAQQKEQQQRDTLVQQDQQQEAPPGSSAQPVAKRAQPDTLAGDSYDWPLAPTPTLEPSDMQGMPEQRHVERLFNCSPEICSTTFSLLEGSPPPLGACVGMQMTERTPSRGR